MAAAALIAGVAGAADAPSPPLPDWTSNACTYGPYLADTYRPKPAFPGQTQAPRVRSRTPFKGAGRHLIRLTLDHGHVTGEEKLLADRCSRIRDVRQGPDGALYLLTDEDQGQVLRITPRR